MTNTQKSGTVFLVGAGPGDPELITLRAWKLIREADVILYDYLIDDSILQDAKGGAVLVYVGKQRGRHSMPQDEINKQLIEYAAANQCVVRLKGGDPFVFGRGGEEALALVAEGIPFEIVPGVTAAVAACSSACIPLTHRNIASSASFITGHEAPGKKDTDLDYEVLAKTSGTLVFYMGLHNIETICENLIKNGLSGETPAAIVEAATMPQEKILTATVATLAQCCQEHQCQPPGLIIIGEVVGLRRELTEVAH